MRKEGYVKRLQTITRMGEDIAPLRKLWPLGALGMIIGTMGSGITMASFSHSILLISTSVCLKPTLKAYIRLRQDRTRTSSDFTGLKL